jgi:hypothetical protein
MDQELKRRSQQRSQTEASLYNGGLPSLGEAGIDDDRYRLVSSFARLDQLQECLLRAGRDTGLGIMAEVTVDIDGSVDELQGVVGADLDANTTPITFFVVDIDHGSSSFPPRENEDNDQSPDFTRSMRACTSAICLARVSTSSSSRPTRSFS